MLILTRRIGESIRIDDDIIVTIVKIKGNNVSVGISAPSRITVHREELYNRLQRELNSELSSSLFIPLILISGVATRCLFLITAHR